MTNSYRDVCHLLKPLTKFAVSGIITVDFQAVGVFVFLRCAVQCLGSQDISSMCGKREEVLFKEPCFY